MHPSGLSIGIDYIQGMAQFESFKGLENFINGISPMMVKGDRYYFSGEAVTIGKKFQNRISSVKGLWGGFNYGETYLDCHIQIPGTICRELTNPCKSLEEITKHFKKTTRIDICIDDYKRRIKQKTLARLAEKGHYKGLQSFRQIASKGDSEESSIGTCIFGNSDKILKYYNAEFMHDIPADRWELLLRGDYAEVCKDEIIQAGDIKAAGKFITGAIDFIQPGETWRHDKRYQFWQSIIDELGEAKLRIPKDEATLERALEWLERQAGPTLAVLKFGLGDLGFSKIMSRIAERSTERLRENHLTWINYLNETGEKPDILS